MDGGCPMPGRLGEPSPVLLVCSTCSSSKEPVGFRLLAQSLVRQVSKQGEAVRTYSPSDQLFNRETYIQH